MIIYLINIMAIFVYLEEKVRMVPHPMPVLEKLPDQWLKSKNKNKNKKAAKQLKHFKKIYEIYVI